MNTLGRDGVVHASADPHGKMMRCGRLLTQTTPTDAAVTCSQCPRVPRPCHFFTGSATGGCARCEASWDDHHAAPAVSPAT